MGALTLGHVAALGACALAPVTLVVAIILLVVLIRRR